MDFLLECIGFAPDEDPSSLAERARVEGEATPWRGDSENHRRLVLGEGLELRVDREPGQDFWTMLPHYRVPHRLRVAVESLRRVSDSPFDALLTAWAAPPMPGEPEAGGRPGAYRFASWLTDARRLPRRLPEGHVLAVSIAGFALNVDYVGPNDGVSDPGWLERPRGAWVTPLGGADAPGGCSEVSLRVREVRHLRNVVTGRTVDLVVTDAPERPLILFLSPWQLARDALPAPRPGWRLEGSFLFTGTTSGGLPRRRR